jgi:hypothetical protein
MRKIRLALGALLLGAVLAASQNSTGGPSPAQTVPVPPRAQFFAGTIVEFDATHIKVSRTLVGRPTESRSFSVTPGTKMNKSVIKLHSRVTVRYKRLPEGDTALEIQPRPVVARTPKV